MRGAPPVVRPLGMTFAKSLVSPFLLLLSGCVVTEQIEFPPETNYPPALLSSPDQEVAGTALGQIIDVDLDDDETEIALGLVARDVNVDDELTWQLYVDRVGDSLSLVRTATLEPTSTFERSFTVRFTESALGGPGCHKLEVFISSDFIGEREPREDGDIAQAVWWVRATNSTQLSVEMSTCP